MKNTGMKIKHPKLRGEWAELRFMTRAAEHGLCVTKPWGETSRYDFAVEHEERFVRVQVKSTMFKDRGGYSCSVRGCRGPYTGDPFDFVAAYLIPEDLWYIIPAQKIQGQGSIALYPQLKDAKYGRGGQLPSPAPEHSSRTPPPPSGRSLAAPSSNPGYFRHHGFPVLKA